MNLADYGLSYRCNLYGIPLEGDYIIKWISARELLVPERIDLMGKLIYVEDYYSGRKSEFARELYVRNIEACTLGCFVEFGKEKSKNNIESFVECFENLMDDIKANGFELSKGVIPVARDGMILDGAHRVAIAAFLNLKVPVIQFDISEKSMDIQCFLNRMLPLQDLEYYCVELCKWRKDLYLSCLWPAAKGEEKRQKAINIIKRESKVLFCKNINISYNGINNLIPQIYVSHDWVGGIEDRFISATPKILGVYDESGKLSVIIFQCSDLIKVKKIKEKIRGIFGIYENSIHITDYPEETLSLAKMLYHENTVKFLNKAQPFKYIELNKKLSVFKKMILLRNLSLDDFVVDSSTIMGLYGIRKPEDIDYLSIISDAGLENEYINNHEEDKVFHDKSIVELIYNPAMYINYFDIKVITLENLFAFKKQRGSQKDKEDLIMIGDCLEDRYSFKGIAYKWYQEIKRSMRNFVYKTIVRGGVYNQARYVYHAWKKLRKLLF